jgi:hypothetical protein
LPEGLLQGKLVVWVLNESGEESAMLPFARAVPRSARRLLPFAYRPQVEALEDRVVPAAFVRLNQVGYVLGSPMRALLLASAPEAGAQFQVLQGSTVEYTSAIGPKLGGWSPAFPDVYLLDLSAAALPAGSYTISVTGPLPATSPAFHVSTGDDLYTPLLRNALFFYEAQRDGPNQASPTVMGRQPSHLTDESASVYAKPAYTYTNGSWYLSSNLANLKVAGVQRDVSGGWFDAGDYLKFVETASYTEAILLLTARDYPSLVAPGTSADFFDEARFGLDWLLKMWDDGTRTLYYQVGIGDGNQSGTEEGDHDVNFRLPEADDQRNAHPGSPDYYVEYRPVLRSGPAGSLISPNLAGRLAADFALAYQVYAASDPTLATQCLVAAAHVFGLARTSSVGTLLTTSPGGTNGYYPETVWQDDMELGATELYFAAYEAQQGGGLPAGVADPSVYLHGAGAWAKAYITGPNDGSEPLNLYDVSGLTHYELDHAIAQANDPAGLGATVAAAQQTLRNDLKGVLDAGVTQAGKDPFGFGIAYAGGLDLVPHALGLALEASFYDELTGTSTYAAFSTNQLAWVLGANAWGSSFVVGAGTVYPHSLHHQVANLYDLPDGSMATLLGATVDGPSMSSNFGGLTTPPGADPSGPSMANNPFKRFNARGVNYWDNVASWPTVEPADDYTALTVLLFARLASGGTAPAPAGVAVQPFGDDAQTVLQVRGIGTRDVSGCSLTNGFLAAARETTPKEPAPLVQRPSARYGESIQGHAARRRPAPELLWVL